MDGEIILEVMSFLKADFQILYNAEKGLSFCDSLNDEVKSKIMDEGLYHITTKENAYKIMESGFLAPSKGKMANHFSKSRNSDEYANYVYMFAGKPNVLTFLENVGKVISDVDDGTVYAIKHKPNKFEVNNYTQRYGDGAITYEGRLDLENSNPEIVRLCLELENGKLKLNEVPLDKEYKKMYSNDLSKKIIGGSIGKIAGIGLEIVGIGINRFAKQLIGDVFYDKTEKLKQKIDIRKTSMKVFEQYNREKCKKNIEINNNGKEYVIHTGNDKFVDGRPLTEYEMVTKEEPFVTKRIYSEPFDLSVIEDDKLKNFFEKNVDFESDLDQYVGEVKMKDGELVQNLDSEFNEHFRKKQETRKKIDPQYEIMLSEKSKKQKNVFKEFYTKTSAISRKKARDFISKLLEKSRSDKTQENNITEIQSDMVK